MQCILQIDGNMDIVADISHYEQINENVQFTPITIIVCNISTYASTSLPRSNSFGVGNT